MHAEDHQGGDTAPAAVTVDAEIICDAKLDYCVCVLAPGHAGPHVCGRDDGSWEYSDDGELRIVAFPDVLKALGYKD